MEVASHTAAHRFPAEDMDGAVIRSMRDLSLICGYKVKGLAYPGGVYTAAHLSALRTSGILYARTCAATHSLSLPEDLLVWHPTCKFDDEALPGIVDEFLAYTGDVPALLYLYGHSYELTREVAPRSWESFEQLLNQLSGQSDIWYASNAEIAEWMKDCQGR